MRIEANSVASVPFRVANLSARVSIVDEGMAFRVFFVRARVIFLLARFLPS